MSDVSHGSGDQNVSENFEVPAGFERIPEGLGFGDHLQPLYRRLDGRDVSFAFLVSKSHLNMMGICHGGALMTLADIAAAASLYHRRSKPTPAPTINLSFDFIAPARPGAWVYSRADHVEPRNRFGFCSGALYSADELLVRYNGTFYLTSPRADGEREDAESRNVRSRMAKLMGVNG